jgi:hypothetical protein
MNVDGVCLRGRKGSPAATSSLLIALSAAGCAQSEGYYRDKDNKIHYYNERAATEEQVGFFNSFFADGTRVPYAGAN